MAGNWPGKVDNYPRLGVRVTELFGSCRTVSAPPPPPQLDFAYCIALVYCVGISWVACVAGVKRGERREETVAGGLLFTQTKNLLHKYKTIEFELVGERPAIKYIQIGWRVEKFHRFQSQPTFFPFKPTLMVPFFFPSIPLFKVKDGDYKHEISADTEQLLVVLFTI